MMINNNDVSNISQVFSNLVNKYNKMSAVAFDFGTGDRIYTSEMHTLVVIGHNIGNNVNDISLVFGVTKGAVSQIVNKLHKKGLIDKDRNPDNYKEIMLTLTERGRIACEGHATFHERMNDELLKELKCFNKADLEKFEEFMLIIEKHLDRLYNEKT
jgi:DNA-binding MarR family transcriptional regulator